MTWYTRFRYRVDKGIMFKNGSLMLLKLTVWLVGMAVLALCLFVLPSGIMTDRTGWYRPILLGMYIPAIPFFIALYQSTLLLRYIDAGTAFSELSVQALRRIKLCAFSVSGLYALGMPYIFYVADLDDAPGVAAIGFVIIFAAFVIATAVNLMQHLLQQAVDIQSENSLTV